jgi:SAM-dependent methyltransferase
LEDGLNEMNSTLQQLLNAYWLRPETALWRQLDILAMKNFEFKSPSLDIGCGDGLFSFIRAGGQMNLEFDAFRFVTDLEKYFENVDIYDTYQASSKIRVVANPNYQIDIGFDHKANLLRMSEILEIYKETIHGVANALFPFENDRFESIFSNILYWLDKPENAISEITRILKPGGKACLMLPSNTLPEYSFYNQYYIKTKNQAYSFLEKLDRGRFSDQIKHSRASIEWENIFIENKLSIVSHVKHISKLNIQIWDIGLRPLFPLLKKITDSIEDDKFLNIKSEWIQTVRMFIEPLINLDSENSDLFEPAFNCYIVEKK